MFPVQPFAPIGVTVYVIVTLLEVVLVYVSVIASALAVVRAVPAATCAWLLEATVYVYVSPDKGIKASKLKFNATSLHVSAVCAVTTGSGLIGKVTVKDSPEQPAPLTGTTV